MSLKIPAIRSKMGIWFYYVSSLSFKEVSRYVRQLMTNFIIQIY